jgi:hypothetical protein
VRHAATWPSSAGHARVDDRDAVRAERLIRRQDRQALGARLRDEQPIEGIGPEAARRLPRPGAGPPPAPAVYLMISSG